MEKYGKFTIALIDNVTCKFWAPDLEHNSRYKSLILSHGYICVFYYHGYSMFLALQITQHHIWVIRTRYKKYRHVFWTKSMWNICICIKWINAILELYVEINGEIYTGTWLGINWFMVKFWYTETLRNLLEKLNLLCMWLFC